MFRSTIVALAAVVITSPIGAQAAGDHIPSDVTFNLRRSFLEELMTTGSTGHSVGARWKETLRMDQHSAVHQLASDCEIHVGAKVQQSSHRGPSGHRRRASKRVQEPRPTN